RARVRELRPALDADFAPLVAPETEPLLAAAAAAAQRSLGATLDLLDGHPLPEPPDLEPRLILGADLLRVPGLVVDADLEPPAATPCARLLEARGPVDAIVDRTEAGDYAGAGILLNILGRRDDKAAEPLIVARDQALRGEREAAGREYAQTDRSLDLARLTGRVNEAAWRELRGRLEDAADPDRLDLRHVREELEEIRTELDVTYERRRLEFGLTFAEARATSADVEAAAPLIERLVQVGDLASAEDQLQMARAGETLDTAPEPRDDLKAFFPAVPAALARRLPTEAGGEVERGGRVAGLSFAPLTPAQRRRAADAVRAWVAFARDTSNQRLNDLVRALRIAGIEASAPRPRGARAPERSWIDLTGINRTGKALVPDFGSSLGATLPVLLIHGQPPPERVVEWASEDATQRAIVVLYFGVLSPDQRRDLARAVRRKGRPIVVLDDAAFLYLAHANTGLFETFMAITLPFAGVNPFHLFRAGDVPVEMFYGRSEERRAITAPAGTSLIYGGRQLGKTALLRAAAREFERAEGQRALYVDLQAATIAQLRQPELIWGVIWSSLVRAGITREGQARADAQRVTRAIHQWLQGAPERRLLLLLDEADDFLDQDAEVKFQHTNGLRALMDQTGSRFKVVFAGLHHVTRFSAITNQPLAHLGRPEPIGPLSPPQAFELIATPLRALGYSIERDQVARILSFCNYTPVNLQLVGQALVDHMLRRTVGADEPRFAIAGEDLDQVLAQRTLRDLISERFNLTLDLDRRYNLIANAFAYWAEDQPGRWPAITLQQLRAQCDYWWKEGFLALAADQFRALVEEMVDLGVFAVADGGGYRLRNPSVRWMLGDRQHIEQRLLTFAGGDVPPRFPTSESRRLLEAATGRRSPLTEGQLADLVAQHRSRLHLVVGCKATGIEAVPQALATAAQSLGPTLSVKVAASPREYARELGSGIPGQHRVLVAPLTETAPDSCADALERALTTEPPRGVTRSVVLVGGPIEWIASALDNPQLAVTALRRFDAEGTAGWARDQETAFQSAEDRAVLLQATGGWPILVDRVASALARGRTPADALAALRDHLSRPEGAGELVAAVFGTEPDATLGRAWRALLATLDGPEPEDGLLALLADEHAEPDIPLAVLEALGALTVTGERHLGPEPVLRQAYALATGGRDSPGASG
ncbi:MAG: AAA family ATPase, partial [Actinomycetota bacterium]